MAGSPGHYPRLDLLKALRIKGFVKKPWSITILQTPAVIAFLFLIFAGLAGTTDPYRNLTPAFVWVVWWASLVITTMFLGTTWCTICPWNAIATWVKYLSFWKRGNESMSLDLKWPKALRNSWPAAVFLLVFVWLELGSSAPLNPRLTGAMGLAMLMLAVVWGLFWDRRAFCRYVCFVGRIVGIYAQFAPVELRRISATTCASCVTNDCYKGNDHGYGCPTQEFPRVMDQNTYCILCYECVKTCPHDNITVNLRPMAADLLHSSVTRRMDEAWLCLIVLAMTTWHGLAMTPMWKNFEMSAAQQWRIAPGWIFTAGMVGIVLLQAALYGLFAWITHLVARGVSFREVFVNFAFAVLPVALFYHLGHDCMHLFSEGQIVFAQASDPLGWGWNLFGTAGKVFPATLDMPTIWWIQVVCVVIGQLFGSAVAIAAARRLYKTGWSTFASLVPMTGYLIVVTLGNLWLLFLPMILRTAS